MSKFLYLLWKLSYLNIILPEIWQTLFYTKKNLSHKISVHQYQFHHYFEKASTCLFVSQDWSPWGWIFNFAHFWLYLNCLGIPHCLFFFSWNMNLLWSSGLGIWWWESATTWDSPELVQSAKDPLLGGPGLLRSCPLCGWTWPVREA